MENLDLVQYVSNEIEPEVILSKSATRSFHRRGASSSTAYNSKTQYTKFNQLSHSGRKTGDDGADRPGFSSAAVFSLGQKNNNAMRHGRNLRPQTATLNNHEKQINNLFYL